MTGFSVCKKITILCCLILSTFQQVNSQNISREDYKRAVSFLWENINNKTAFNLHVSPNWFPDNSGLWYVLHDDKGKTIMKIDYKKMKSEPLFNHKILAKGLAAILNKEVFPAKLPFNSVKYVDAHTIEFEINHKKFRYSTDNQEVEEYNKKEEIKSPFESISPDGEWTAFTKDYNLYLISNKTKEKIKLSTTGKKNYEYASWYGWYDKMEGENGERPKRFYVNWSPDSKYLATGIVDLRHADKMYLLDWSIDSLYRPKLLSYYRGSPGDTTMVHIVPVIYDIETKKEIKTGLPTNTHINVVSLRWGEKKGTVFANYQERGYQKNHLIKLNLELQTEDEILLETTSTNIDRFNYRMIEGTPFIIFTSERSGWNQIYLLNANTKEVTPLTKGKYFVNDLKYIDELNKIIYYTASGRETDRNPYHQYLYSVDLEGNTVLLTPENSHHIIDVSENGTYFMDNYSTASIPTKTVLRKLTTGKIVSTIAESNIEKIKLMGWKAPQIFETFGRDGKTIIYGALWKPTNFDPSKKYPIIDHSYTGPHTQMFPKDYRRVLSLSNQALAELGFVVMMVDGMGSTGRSKAFRNVSYKNMGKNLVDHKLAIEQLAKKHPWIDGEKVGIYGHSAGGYDAAHALLEFPEFYKVAVSSSADHDFRMEKAWWPEMYMGWPVDEKYQEVSNITMAGNLKGKLLLVHGGIDDNVNPSATFKLSEALIKADKEFDLLIIPSQRHGYRGAYSKYFLKKRWNYFVKNLRGIEPIWKFDWN